MTARVLGSSSRLTLAAITFVICAYFCGGFANNVCMNAIGDLTVAMVDDHSLQIDRYSGNSNDISTRNGHFYSGFGPGLSFLLVPVYLAMKPILALVPESVMSRADTALSNGIYAKHGKLKSTESRAKVVLLIVAGTLAIAIPFGMLSVVYILRTSRALIPALSYDDLSRLSFVAMFGTIIFAFAIHLTHTAVAACLIWIAIARSLPAATNGVTNESPWVPLCNGLLLGFAPCVDYPASLYALLAGAFIIFIAPHGTRLRRTMLMGVGAAPALLASWAYHWAAFGSAFTNAYRFRLRAPDRGIFDIRHLGPTLPNPEKLYVAFLHPFSGLFLYFPVLLLGVVLACYFVMSERERLRRLFWSLCAATMLMNIGIYSCYPLSVGPASGATFGVRYTAYSAPFALIAVAAWLARLPPGHIWRKALLGLAVFNALPVLAFILYGAPVFPSRGYGTLLMQLGPGNYTFTKLNDAGILRSPLLPWLGTVAICGLLLWWRKIARVGFTDRSATTVVADTALSDVVGSS